MFHFRDVEHLAALLTRAAEAHHAYEHVLGHHDEDWPQWYADFICRHASEPTEPPLRECYGAGC